MDYTRYYIYEFEKPLLELYQVLEDLQNRKLENASEFQETLLQIEYQKKKIYGNLSRWEKVQLARHPLRPYTLYYISQISETFTELHGDRHFADDKAIVGGLARIADESIVWIGQQKGTDTKSRQYRNFGMAMPEGYRKAKRLMTLAEKFNFPVVCFVDTPGAYPGIEAEQRGQAEAIAQNIFAMMQLKVPIIVLIIGEGASGGALGIGIGDRVVMLEHTWYSVISPESCSSILWGTWDYKERAAEALQVTAADMQRFGLIDHILQEPTGGAHHQPAIAAKAVRKIILKYIDQLKQLPTKELIDARLEKYCKIGIFQEGK